MMRHSGIEILGKKALVGATTITPLMLIAFWRWSKSRILHSAKRGPVIWMVNHYAVTEDMPGGTRHLDLARLLLRFRWRTEIFASSFNHNSHRFVRRGTFPWSSVKETVDGVGFTWVPSTPYTKNDIRRYLNMVSFMLLFLLRMPFRARPDLILGSSAHLLAALAAYVASRRHRVPFVLEIRDVWPDSLIQLGLSDASTISALRLLEAYLYDRADLIIGVSEGIADRIRNKGVDPSKIEVIAHGIARPPALTEEERTLARSALGWDGRVVLIWAGSLQPFNGLDTLISAAHDLRDLPELLVVLLGDGSERDMLMTQARGLSSVVFHPSVPKSEIWSWLIAADIGILTSRRFEAFTGVRPRKIFDYMAAGLPVVCTVPGEAWQVLKEAEAGVFAEWENPSALADAIRSLVNHSERRGKLGRNGREAVANLHSIERSAEKLCRLLEGVVKGHHSGRRAHV